MRVLVDTCIWSLSLRRHAPDLNASETRVKNVFAELIREGRVVLIGPIRQELLSGLRERAQCEKLREKLRSFSDVPIQTSDFERAAAMSNHCSASGVANTDVDMMICSVAAASNCTIFSTDRDFQLYSRVLPIRLFPLEGA